MIKNLGFISTIPFLSWDAKEKIAEKEEKNTLFTPDLPNGGLLIYLDEKLIGYSDQVSLEFHQDTMEKPYSRDNIPVYLELMVKPGSRRCTASAYNCIIKDSNITISHWLDEKPKLSLLFKETSQSGKLIAATGNTIKGDAYISSIAKSNSLDIKGIITYDIEFEMDGKIEYQENVI